MHNKMGYFCWFLFLIAGGLLFADKPAAETNPADICPVFESPEVLKQLDQSDPIWVTPDRKAVVLVGTISLREGLLEFLACRKGTKDYESIITLDVKPYLIHAGLLLIGAEKGHPARFDPEFSPPTGSKISIMLRWKEADGSVKEVAAGDLIRNTETGEVMTTSWVFTGSVTGKDAKGNPYYLANITGELIGVSNFAGSILDVPFESSSENDQLSFEPNTEKIPPDGTEVTLILRVLESD